MPGTVKPDAVDVLSEVINNKGIKKTFLADKMGISPAKLSNILYGRNKFTADLALKAAAALNLSPNIFLNSKYFFKF